MLWTKISPKSVKIVGLNPLACGFIPSFESRDGFWMFGHELWLSGLREYSIGLRPRRLNEFGCLVCWKEGAMASFQAYMAMEVWRTWR